MSYSTPEQLDISLSNEAGNKCIQDLATLIFSQIAPTSTAKKQLEDGDAIISHINTIATRDLSTDPALALRDQGQMVVPLRSDENPYLRRDDLQELKDRANKIRQDCINLDDQFMKDLWYRAVENARAVAQARVPKS